MAKVLLDKPEQELILNELVLKAGQLALSGNNFDIRMLGREIHRLVRAYETKHYVDDSQHQ